MKLKTQFGFISKSVLLILLLMVAVSYALINWRSQNSVGLTTETTEQQEPAQSELAEEEVKEEVAQEPAEPDKTDEASPEPIATEPVVQDEAVQSVPIVEGNVDLLPNSKEEKNYYLPPELDIGTMPSEDVAAMMEIRPPDPNAVPPGEPPDPNIPPPGEPANPYLPPPGEPASTIPPPGAEDGDFIIGTLEFAEPGKIIKPEDRENQATTNTQ